MTHKLENNCIKEVLALLQKFYGPQQIPKPGDPAKGLRTPKEFDFEGQWDLITELPQTRETNSWRAQTKHWVHQDPQEMSQTCL